MRKVVCYGEVLWDVLPTGKKIGGAPLNVAIRLRALGNESYVISSVGNDELGKQLINEVNRYNINTDFIQTEEELATSEVQVKLDKKGSATYDIIFPRAWDKIKYTEASKDLVKSSDAIIFGSLVARNDTSKETLFKYIEYANYKVFDVNLRPPHYTQELLINLMQKADFIKFNDDELYQISNSLGSNGSELEESIRFLSENTDTKHICVTLGDNGAVLFYDKTFYYNKGYKIKVADTVGSGDSFLASLISQLLNNNEPQAAINFACAVGAMVAKCEGANPMITREDIYKFINFN